MPNNVTDNSYGKMRPLSTEEGSYLYYRCRARDFGNTCPQKTIRADLVEEQVVQILKKLKPPKDWNTKIIGAMSQLLGDQKIDDRIDEIKTVIERMDFRWDNGFISDQETYLEQRVKLQQELENLTPIADDDIAQAADLLNNFANHWELAQDSREAQQKLIQLIVARIWVRGNAVVAMSLRPNCHVTLGLGSEKPTEIAVGFSKEILRERGRRGSMPTRHNVRLLPPIRVRWNSI